MASDRLAGSGATEHEPDGSGGENPNRFFESEPQPPRLKLVNCSLT